MGKGRCSDLSALGQSIWYDYIRRGMIRSGELREMIDDRGLRGVTSNPTIFERAISGSTDYDDALKTLLASGKSIPEIFDALAVEDIQMACDAFKAVHIWTEGRDGFVSIEVSPKLAYDTERTIAEARRLHALVNRPNVMIKIPATPAGLPAIEAVIAAGINVNVTLIFSVERYAQVAEAYLKGLERLAAEGKPLGKVASVASFFVSRVDTLVDRLLEEKAKPLPYPAQKENLKRLQGKVAVANAKLMYQKFKAIFQTPRFQALAAKGARVQRPLWASTGTKNPAYGDLLYVNELIGPDTVNTVPPQTLTAFEDHGTAALTLEKELGEAHTVMARLAEGGIDLLAALEELEKDGVRLFAESYDLVMRAIAAKKLLMEGGVVDRMAEVLGEWEGAVARTLEHCEKEQTASRIWNRDAALWKKEPEQHKSIKGALGWLSVTDRMQEEAEQLQQLAEKVRREGCSHVVLIGMGGSSLAPRVLADLFSGGRPELIVLDTTDPRAVAAVESRVALKTTVFIVASKSGTTAEVTALYHYFRERLQAVVGDEFGRHFLAITDPGSPLEEMAKRNGFRRVFLNPADIGGRYSALSFFGLVPAALLGIDLPRFLERAELVVHSTVSCIPSRRNPGLRLGAILGELAHRGCDKLTLVTGKRLASFALWVEQLIAESTGKNGKGILPVVGEELGAPNTYGGDRLFVYIGFEGAPEPAVTTGLARLQTAGHPVIMITLPDPMDLGGEFFRWEFATAVTGMLLGINPFDQPDVEASKVKTREILGRFRAERQLPAMTPALSEHGLTFFLGEGVALPGKGGGEILRQFLGLARPGQYLAVQAYFEPLDESVAASLQRVRRSVTTAWKIPATLGFGPRFLHSTGQLHKGGPNTGLFLQLTADLQPDLAIPGETAGLGTMLAAQALGDFQVLSARARRIVRVHLGSDLGAGLERLASLVEEAAAVKPSSP